MQHITRGTLLVLATLLPAPAATGQDFEFGSRDDPGEQASVTWWQSYTDLFATTGFSLIGPQWRTAGRLDAEMRRSQSSLRLSGTLRAGIYGSYSEDTDERYDLLRLISYARFRRHDDAVYVRVGPLNRTRLGTGHLVNFLSTETAWDKRSVGAESSVRMGYFQLQGFMDDILGPELLGARLALAPFGGSRSRFAATFTVGATHIADRVARTRKENPLQAQAIDVSFEAYRSGGFSFLPFASGARIPDYGQGLFLGADVKNENFIDLARLHFRLGVHYGSSRFIPGYFGSFYQVRSLKSGILARSGTDTPMQAGVQLGQAERGNAVVSEFRILVFDQFELWYQFMRHYGGRPQSEYHLRLFMHGQRFELAVGQDRGGLRNFFSLFKELEDENRMHFAFAYNVYRLVWLQVEARYTYERVQATLDVRDQFIVQRRFDPLIGLRVRF